MSLALPLGACSDAPTICESPELLLSRQVDLSDWRPTADSLLAVSPPDSVLHVIVFLHPQAKQAFVDWAVSTGGGFGYGFVIVEPESSAGPPSDPNDRRQGRSPPETVPGVMIRYEWASASAFSVYLPVWALQGLKDQNITGVEFGIGAGAVPLC
jgi:hypothetical protein